MDKHTPTHRLRTTLLSFCPVATLLLFLLPSRGFAGAYDPKNVSKGMVGAKFGMIYSSRIRTDTSIHDTRIGVSGGIFIDIPVAKNWYAGIDFDLHDLQAFDLRKKWLNAMLVAKRSIPIPKKEMDARFFLGGGVGYFNTFEYVYLEDTSTSTPRVDIKLLATTSLVFKGGVELLFHYSKRTTFITELAVVYSPADFDNPLLVRYGPTFFIRGGIAL